MEDNKEYKYDAFISYRHCELDKFAAVKLHRALETYKLPKSIQKKLGLKKRSFKRIFRDQEELPLTSNLEDPIVDALNNSKYLIVICTPRLKESLWCKKEIETFKKIRGRKNIFCVLVEGEPSDSFPEEVLYDDEKVIINGKTKTERIMVEPLAADIRGKNKKQVLKKLNEEKLRLIAPMYNLDYDDLKQRHKLWRQKKIIRTSLMIALISVLFAIYSIAMFIKIEMQQNVLAKHHALSLVDQATDNLNEDKIYNAVKLSYQALTDFDDIVMPYTPEAEYSLVESLGIYDVGLSYKAVKELKTEGIAIHIKNSPDMKYAAVYDGSEMVTLFDAKSLNIIAKYDVNTTYISDNDFTFIGNEYLAFITSTGSIKIVKTKDGKQVKEIDDDIYQSVSNDTVGNYLIYNSRDRLFIYDIKNNKNVGNISKLSKDEKYVNEMYVSSDSKYLFVFTTQREYNADVDDYLTLHVYELETATEVSNNTFAAGYVSGVVTKNNNAYLLLNKIDNLENFMIILSYDYLNGEVNWIKEVKNTWGKIIKKSYPEDSNDIAVVCYDNLHVLNMDDGSLVQSFNTGNEIISFYSYLSQEIYVVFSANGKVNTINMRYGNNIVVPSLYQFNASEYSAVALSYNGYLLIPRNENRVILYETKSNKETKKLDKKYDYVKDESISTLEFENIAKKYDLNNKSLIQKIIYNTKKDIMFVNYKNGDLIIYNVKDKKILKTLKNIGAIDHYFGKDRYGRIYIGDSTDSYILDKKYNKVGHIYNLVKLENDKVIIGNNGNYYSLKIYTLDDIKTDAKKYLKNNKK